jgi:hypothetical protein
MRVLGIVAIFVLSLVSIVEGAFLFRLSHRVSALSADRAAAELEQPATALVETSRRPLPAPQAHARPAAPPAFQTPTPVSPAASTLREALSTVEGREQLKAAMDVIAEERRQTRLAESLPRREERDQRMKDRLLKAVPLTGDEPIKVATLFTNLQTARRQLIEDMRAGLKNAEETDTALDELRDGMDKSLHALLGDDRWRKAREGRRGGGQGGPGAAGGAPTPGGQAPPVSAPAGVASGR